MSLFCPDKARDELTADGAIRWRAPAKLNLTLRILGRRDDGYHEIDSVAAKVTLYDELLFRRRGDGEIRLTCSGLGCGPVEENLIFRAAELMKRSAGGSGAEIELIKRIPPGAGLGGGSSDAAATLQALNRLWELGLTGEQLADLAGRIGSDVPLFLAGPAVRIRGRGEHVEQANVHPFGSILHLPDLHCPTAKVYAACQSTLARSPWRTADYTDYTDSFKKPLVRAKPAVARQSAIHNPQSAIHNPQSAIRNPQLNGLPSSWRGELFNDLEAAALRVCPPLGEISRRLAAATGLPVHLTGSGSALFIVCDDPAEAQSVAARLPDGLKQRCRVVSMNPW